MNNNDLRPDVLTQDGPPSKSTKNYICQIQGCKNKFVKAGQQHYHPGAKGYHPPKKPRTKFA